MKKALLILSLLFSSIAHGQQQDILFYGGGFYSFYGTFDPAFTGGNYVLSANRLTTHNIGGNGLVLCNIGCSSSINKYSYCEITVNSAGYPSVGIANHSENIANGLGATSNSWSYLTDLVGGAQSYKYTNANPTSYGSTFAAGDIMMIALDMVNGYVYFGKNGTWQNSATAIGISAGTGVGAAFSGLTGTLYFGISNFGGNPSNYTANFGATSFTYTPPTGGTNTFTGLHH